MSFVAAAVVGATVVTGAISSNAQKKAAGKAADAQSQAAQAGINAENERFFATQELLSPYVEAGNNALGQQQNLNGANGAEAQRNAIQGIQSSPQYTSALEAGNNNILANASATGGLRGGNVQAALGQFSPALLSASINDQYSRLGGMSAMGLNAATQTGNFGANSTNNIANLLQQQGAATAGGYLAQGKANAQFANSVGQGIGAAFGYGGKF